MGNVQGLSQNVGAPGAPVSQRTPADLEAQRNRIMEALANPGAAANPGKPPPPANTLYAGPPGSPGKPAMPLPPATPGITPPVAGGSAGMPGGKGAGMAAAAPKPPPGGGMPGGKGTGPNRTTNMLMGLKQRPMANPSPTAGISPPGAGLTM